MSKTFFNANNCNHMAEDEPECKDFEEKWELSSSDEDTDSDVLIVEEDSLDSSEVDFRQTPEDHSGVTPRAPSKALGDNDQQEVPVLEPDRFLEQQDENCGPINVVDAGSYICFSEDVSEVHRLIRYHSQDIIYQACAPMRSPCSRHNRILHDCFEVNLTDVACTLLNSAVPRLQCPLHVDERTVQYIAQGLCRAMNFVTETGNPLVRRQGVGRLVAAIMLDRRTGDLLAYVLAQLVPQALMDGDSGDVVGMMLHQVTRGFSADDNYCRIITDYTGPFLLTVNHIPTN
ncbi:uncharacterized protein LOC108091739 [Drosophila ficusphila]|uniref:uncharacterized protein LOC108091739 n=1 Tax=Drosophila ficusphila TaxID=30025 RepID=UPI0007E6E489|nr:uncharacterized protein LOC108091739 [Drosophila ficusphila]